jgi:hypothetical protein
MRWRGTLMICLAGAVALTTLQRTQQDTGEDQVDKQVQVAESAASKGAKELAADGTRVAKKLVTWRVP